MRVPSQVDWFDLDRDKLVEKQAAENRRMLFTFGDYHISMLDKNIVSLAVERDKRFGVYRGTKPPKDCA